MTCSACSAHVEKSVRGVQGVSDVNVNLLLNSMTVDYDENATNPDEIIAAVKSGGYGAYIEGAEKKAASSAPKDDGELKSMKTRLITSICCLVPLMYILSLIHIFYRLGKVKTEYTHYRLCVNNISARCQINVKVVLAYNVYKIFYIVD